jgi:uncharacterized membrane protein YeaQ/YmgE (transglycosylase-associated protein family)
MNVVVWLIIGGFVGWVASMLMNTDGQQGVLMNVIVGIVGAVLGSWLLGGYFGASTINQGNFSLNGLFVSLVGAVILIALLKILRRAT